MNRNTASGKLEKAQLISEESDSIEFAFNPSELQFDQSIRLHQSSGARTSSGLVKISFAHPEPCILTIRDIIFDNYESRTSVLTAINQLKQGLNFASRGAAAQKRPPTYIFAWGQQQYMRCFITRLSYRLTRFLADGTPVQARADLTLTEVDKPRT